MLAYSERGYIAHTALVLGRHWIGLKKEWELTRAPSESPPWCCLGFCGSDFSMFLVFFQLSGCCKLRSWKQIWLCKSTGKWVQQCFSLWFITLLATDLFCPIIQRLITVSEQPIISRTQNKFPFWIIFDFGFGKLVWVSLGPDLPVVGRAAYFQD